MGKLFAGLDVADKATSLCIVDDHGEVVFETVADTTPEAIAGALKPYRRRLKSVGQETGIKAAWLHKELTRAKMPMVTLDARHAHAALKANLNKTDGNDALGLATLLARGIYTTAYVKSDKAIRMRTLLVLRESLVRKSRDLAHCIRMARKHLGTEHVVKRRRKSEQTEIDILLSIAFEAAARLGERVAAEAENLGKEIAKFAADDPLCARLMEIPGVGPITAVTFVSAIDDPTRFKSSREVGPYLGLTPRTFQSGESTRSGGISHRGDAATRKALYMAARTLLIASHADWSVRHWGLRLAKAKGQKVAYIAVARKLAVLMHRLWITGEEFDMSHRSAPIDAPRPRKLRPSPTPRRTPRARSANRS